MLAMISEYVDDNQTELGISLACRAGNNQVYQTREEDTSEEFTDRRLVLKYKKNISLLDDLIHMFAICASNWTWSV